MKCLGVLGEELRKLGIKAEFEEWTGKIPKQYWVYEYIESENNHETNCKSGVLILDGFSRDGLSELEKQKDKIINKFMDFRKIVGNTTIFFGSANGQIIKEQYTELKRIQINIDFKEWRSDEK